MGFYLFKKDNNVVGCSKILVSNPDYDCVECKEEEYLRYEKNFNIIINNQKQIAELKQQLADMDYKGQKYLDGEYTKEEWAKIVAERKAIRQQIRDLEGKQ